jgi:uroporphyrinogen decarboxylase
VTLSHSSQGILADLRACAECREPSRVPCLPLGCDFDVRQTPYTHKEYRTDPEKMLDLWRIILKKFDYDWALLFPDDLIEWEFSGIKSTDDPWVPPGVLEYLPPTRGTLSSLGMPDPLRDRRMPLHLEGLRLLRREFGDSVCITGRVAAPFTAVGLVIGVEAAFLLMLEEPDLFREWMVWAERVTAMWAQAQVEAGAHALWVGDCLATSKFIPLDGLREFALEPAAKTASAIARLGAFSFYHGNETRADYLLAAASDLEVSAINVGEHADLAGIKSAIGGKRCLMGNLDPIAVLQNGTEAHVIEETKRLVNAAKTGGGYIFCTGEGIPHNTPPANVSACVRTVRQVGHYGMRPTAAI